MKDAELYELIESIHEDLNTILHELSQQKPVRENRITDVVEDFIEVTKLLKHRNSANIEMRQENIQAQRGVGGKPIWAE